MKIKLLTVFIFFATIGGVGYSFTRSNATDVEINEHLEHSEINHHEGTHTHHHGIPEATTQVTLNVPPTISPNQSTNLVLEVQDADEEPVNQFDVFQEKLMHLIVVSDDLQFFNHLHPTYLENGNFQITTAFPKPGNYTLYADYKPTGKSEQISVLKTSISGEEATQSMHLDTTPTKRIGKTKVNLELNKSVRPGEEVTVKFNLKDAEANKAVTDLKPYLGEMGHLVIIKQSDSLNESSYLHAHALKGTEANQVAFQTQFPEPGNYKLWGQFNRNGEIITADFWVTVS